MKGSYFSILVKRILLLFPRARRRLLACFSSDVHVIVLPHFPHRVTLPLQNRFSCPANHSLCINLFDDCNGIIRIRHSKFSLALFTSIVLKHGRISWGTVSNIQTFNLFNQRLLPRKEDRCVLPENPQRDVAFEKKTSIMNDQLIRPEDCIFAQNSLHVLVWALTCSNRKLVFFLSTLRIGVDDISSHTVLHLLNETWKIFVSHLTKQLTTQDIEKIRRFRM
mmetsp:Transcript_20101/g.32191  ORF Transcript_20101/g.32191 Transcript_20101/m.32191 type:complete len:222 (-) Transcript_20101:3786-4451(-)